MKRYDKLVPDDSFMGRYLQFMKRQETARAFDFWCGLWAIAGVCGRNTYVARPRAPVYLNMYLILIGESGVARKTTSVSAAAKLVQTVNGDDGEIGFIGAKTATEQFDNILHNRTMDFGSAQMCIAVPELAVFLGKETYSITMPILLTDLYDCPEKRIAGGTITRGACIQRNVWLSFLSASTPIWLLKTVNPNVVEGGFTSRCLFVVSNQPKQKIPWPDGEDTEDEWSWLLYDLRSIHGRATKGEAITLTEGAMGTYRKWYTSRKHSFDAFIQSFEAREDAHVLRVAALLSINDDSWRVDHHHVTKAIQLVTELKKDSATIFEGGELRTKYATCLDQVRSILITAGMDPVPKYVLSRKCRRGLDKEQFDAMLEVLHEIGAIQKFMDPMHERGRPAEYIRGTNMLLARGLGDQVLEKFM